MGYNNVVPIDESIYLKHRFECAKDFAEGNVNLEKLLLTLWSFGVKTKACCIGHKETRPYILLTYKENKREIFKRLLPEISESLNIYFIKRKNRVVDVYIGSNIKDNGQSLFDLLINNINGSNSTDFYDVYFDIIKLYLNKKIELEIEFENNCCSIFTNGQYTCSNKYDVSHFLRNKCINKVKL